MEKDDMYDLCFLECYLHTKDKKYQDFFLKYLLGIKIKLEYEKKKNNYQNSKCALSICKDDDYCFHNYLLENC